VKYLLVCEPIDLRECGQRKKGHRQDTKNGRKKGSIFSQKHFRRSICDSGRNPYVSSGVRPSLLLLGEIEKKRTLKDDRGRTLPFMLSIRRFALQRKNRPRGNASSTRSRRRKEEGYAPLEGIEGEVLLQNSILQPKARVHQALFQL